MKTLERMFMTISLCMAMAGAVSCNIIGDVIDGIGEITAEANEIASGKVFTVEKGEVTYNDGSVVTFKDYGKIWQLKDGNELTIFKEGVLYTIDLDTNTGYRTDYADSYSGCPFIFWEKLYEYGDKLGGDVRKSTETIAGKKCTVFTTSDGESVGGWERVLFKSDELVAQTWSGTVPSGAFSTDGYTINEY